MSIQDQKNIASIGTPIDALVISSADAAEYIERMCTELAGLADRGGLGFLAYLLEVAREEAVLHCEAPVDRTLVMHGELPPG